MDNLKQQWQSDDNRTIEYIVHNFNLSDVEDPELYAAQPIYEWQQTDSGKYVMEHSKPEPVWTRSLDYNAWGYKYVIKAYFTPKELTYWKLKFE